MRRTASCGSISRDGDLTPVVEAGGTIEGAGVRPDGAVWFRHESGQQPPAWRDAGTHSQVVQHRRRAARGPSLGIGLVREPGGPAHPGVVPATRRRAAVPDGRIGARRPQLPQHRRVRTSPPSVRRRGVRRAARELPGVHGVRARVPAGALRQRRVSRVRGHQRWARPCDRGRSRRSCKRLPRGVVVGRIPRDAQRGPAPGTMARRDRGDTRSATRSPPTTRARLHCGPGTSP